MNQSIFHLAEIISRRRWPALATFVSVMCGAIIYLVVTPKLYEAKVRVLLDDKQLSVSEVGRELTAETDTVHANPIATQAEIVRSQRVLHKALDAALPMVGAKGSPEKELTLDQLKSALKVSIVPATSILEISYKSQDPLLTAKVLNSVAVAMQMESTEQIRMQAHSARQFLETEVPKKRKELAQVEAGLSQYKQSHGIISLTDANGQEGSQVKGLIESLTNLDNQDQALLAQLREAKARDESLRKILGTGKLKNAYAAVRIGEDEELKSLRAKLAALETEIAVERTRLTDNNPALLNLLEKRDATQRLYNQRLSRLLPKNAPATYPSNIASDNASQDLYTRFILGEVELSALESKLAAVRNERAKFQAKLTHLPTEQQELATLTRQRDEAASSLQSLQRKLEETRIAEAQVLGNVEILDFAKPPTASNWPKKSVVLAVAMVTGTIMATGTVLLLELLDKTLRNATEIKELVKLPILGSLPLLSSSLVYPEIFLEDLQAFESYRTLLKLMQFRRNKGLRTVVVSSTIPGEGKSVVVSHLATVSATLFQRTLIIDADLHQPTQHKTFNLSAQPGLTDVIGGCISLTEAVQQTGIKNLWALSCGEIYTHPSQVLESTRMHTLLAEVSNSYDLVIIDTPPLTSCVDAASLSHHSDGLLLVARTNITPRDTLQQTVLELVRNEVNILGVAVNESQSQNSLQQRNSNKFKFGFKQKAIAHFR